ncbi:MAG: pilin, partial [Patescibacteria group bacterium]
MNPRHRLGMVIASIALVAGVGVAVLPTPSSAALGDALKEGLTNAAPDDLQTSVSDLPTLIGNMIGGVVSLVGAILFVYLLYGGFIWMTAGGDSKKVDTATSIIKNTIIGLVIIVLAYAIATFIIDKVDKATSTEKSGAPT